MEEKTDAAKVLVVDDDFRGRDILTSWLRKHYNAMVDRVYDGKTAVELVAKNHYDLVFMDIIMPIMDGIEATAAIRALEGDYFRKLPVLGMVADKKDDELRKIKFKCGMTEWVEKPISFLKLELILLNYLDQRKTAVLYSKYKKISEKFLGNPDFNENSLYKISDFLEFLGGQNDETLIVFVFSMVVSLYPDTLDERLSVLVRTIIEIKGGRYFDARRKLGIKDDYLNISDDIFYLRNWIKSWLYGLIVTSNHEWDKIKRLQERVMTELREPKDPDREKLAGNVPYQEILAAFCRIKTDTDLQSFNRIFEASILDLIFNLSDLIISKGLVMQEILSTEISFDETCQLIAAHLKHFKKELDDLR